MADASAEALRHVATINRVMLGPDPAWKTEVLAQLLTLSGDKSQFALEHAKRMTQYSLADLQSGTVQIHFKNGMIADVLYVPKGPRTPEELAQIAAATKDLPPVVPATGDLVPEFAFK
jgi:hypothetical protein